MEIAFEDLVLLNAELYRRGLRYRVSFQNDTTACIEPPGACCLTPALEEAAYSCIDAYFQKKGLRPVYTANRLKFTLEKAE